MGNTVSEKILISNYNNLSADQKALMNKWVKLLLRLKAVNEELLETFSSSLERIPFASRNNSLEFELVDSSSLIKGITIEELIPLSLLKPGKGVCEWACHLTSNPDECEENHCKDKK